MKQIIKCVLWVMAGGYCGAVETPREISGAWIGPYTQVVDDKFTTYCSLFILRTEGYIVGISIPGNCESNTDFSSPNLDLVFIGKIYKVVCTGFGEGKIFYELAQGLYVCEPFLRKGDKFITTGGFFSPTREELVCPPSATSEPGVDPDTFAQGVLIANDDLSKSVTKEMYTCQV
eukprot:TRINITY_DN11515_c2_g1_i2.p1 TRINITY_DN11515_c2_g1~~TRINITY_DN11515_c2_g1_i2.p1  ORF type:complete len:175 (+),score=22.08 TRINITY_DN11515_c2_g1_i2:215-739(+)